MNDTYQNIAHFHAERRGGESQQPNGEFGQNKKAVGVRRIARGGGD